MGGGEGKKSGWEGEEGEGELLNSYRAGRSESSGSAVEITMPPLTSLQMEFIEQKQSRMYVAVSRCIGSARPTGSL